MPSLRDIQSCLRKAVVQIDCAVDATSLLVGGRDTATRLAVHRRHYEASLTEALHTKFPAVTWLAGAGFMTAAARTFARQHPPKTPCIAEYGADYPRFLATRAGAERVPYLRSFAELEWLLGQVSIAVDCASLDIKALRQVEADALLDFRLRLQPGLGYCTSAWPVDDLMRLYLSDAAPNLYSFETDEIFLEVRGARGAFQINRLDPAQFLFRSVIADGQPIGSAAETALERDAAFDPGVALVVLFTDGLAIALDRAREAAGA
jgi:hypothetical protein